MLIASSLAILLAFAAPAAPETGAAAQAEVKLSLEAKATLRCAAAFALVSHGQKNGNEAARKWPELTARGREFFVRSLAGLMDETGLDREGISQRVAAEAQALWDNQEVDAVMPSCLVMLERAGL